MKNRTFQIKWSSGKIENIQGVDIVSALIKHHIWGAMQCFSWEDLGEVEVKKLARDIPIGTIVRLNSDLRTGTVIANNIRQGDQVIVLELDDNYRVITADVNDVTIVGSMS